MLILSIRGSKKTIDFESEERELIVKRKNKETIVKRLMRRRRERVRRRRMSSSYIPTRQRPCMPRRSVTDCAALFMDGDDGRTDGRQAIARPGTRTRPLSVGRRTKMES